MRYFYFLFHQRMLMKSCSWFNEFLGLQGPSVLAQAIMAGSRKGSMRYVFTKCDYMCCLHATQTTDRPRVGIRDGEVRASNLQQAGE